MTLYDTSTLAHDADFRERIAAAAAGEGVTDPHPLTWADLHQWQLAATFADQYAYAVAVGNAQPGRDPAVIPDQALIDAVHLIVHPPQPEPEPELEFDPEPEPEPLPEPEPEAPIE